ncbi:hemolysin, partial [Burkholderia sp. MR1-5-21]
MNQALGNIVANVIVTGAGGAVGGDAGAFSGYNVDRFNRQLHEDSKAKEQTLAKRLAEESDGKYTQVQIEDQMRIMGGLIGGDREFGTPATLVGEMPTDPGAKWQYAGTTDNGKPILTQITVQPNPELQRYILANSASAQNDVPHIVYDQTGKKGFSVDVTGPFTKFDQSDVNYVRNTTADTASMISTNAGRVSASAGAAAALPGPHSPEAAALSFGATAVGLGASALQQALNPTPRPFITDSLVDVGNFFVSDRYPLLSPVLNEIAEYIKGSSWINKFKKGDGE